MSLYQQLQEKLNGHPYDGYFSCCCPFHDDHSPSFFVWQESGRYKCKSCGVSGTLEYLNKFLGGYDVHIKKQSKILLPRWKSWEDKWNDLNGIAKHGHLSLIRYPQWNFYFKERQIIQFVEQGFFGCIDGWALFPVFNQEHHIENIVVRSTKKNGIRYAIKPLDEKKPLLYCPSWKRVQENDTVFVPFGIIDVWAFEAIGLPAVTGITGKSVPVELLKDLHKNIVFVPDEWEEKEAHRIANQLGWKAQVKRLIYPDGTKDPDGVRVKFGNDYLSQILGVTV